MRPLPAALAAPDSADGRTLFRRALSEGTLAAATASDGPVLIVNYSRSAVGQTGSGHFSPIAGYDATTDQALVLDTARFKYPPHWMPVELSFAAMQERDSDTGEARGWMMLSRTPAKHSLQTVACAGVPAQRPWLRVLATEGGSEERTAAGFGGLVTNLGGSNGFIFPSASGSPTAPDVAE